MFLVLEMGGFLSFIQEATQTLHALSRRNRLLPCMHAWRKISRAGPRLAAAPPTSCSVARGWAHRLPQRATKCDLLGRVAPAPTPRASPRARLVLPSVGAIVSVSRRLRPRFCPAPPLRLRQPCLLAAAPSALLLLFALAPATDASRRRTPLPLRRRRRVLSWKPTHRKELWRLGEPSHSRPPSLWSRVC